MSAYALDDDLDVDKDQRRNNLENTPRPQRTLQTPATTSARVNPSGGRNALQTLMPMTPPSSGRKPRQNSPHPAGAERQNSRLAQDGSRSSTVYIDRHPPATPQTIGNGEVKADSLPTPSHSHPRTGPLAAAYDKRLDPNYDPMRDPDHRMHHGCDVPRPSVEDVYARQERAWRRMQRWG